MLKHLRRHALTRHPVPPAWHDTLELLPWYPQLTPELQTTLHSRIMIFLHEKTFIGGAGLHVTDPMRVIIAAQASRLELHREPSYYPHSASIFVYPGAFVSTVTHHLPGAVVQHEQVVRIGESWHRGSIVLAWDAVAATLDPAHAGRNVVLHEFAHQLDGWDDEPDGVPRLAGAAAHERWGRVMRRAYRNLHLALASGTAPIDPYAATSPAEFFAVLTELHFEAPEVVLAFDEAVHDALRSYYHPPQRPPPHPLWN